jgi:predicted helicase
MKYTLRDYQQRASDAAVNYFTSNTKGNGLLILPTGAGKSLVIADIASKVDEPLIVLQPNKEILMRKIILLVAINMAKVSGKAIRKQSNGLQKPLNKEILMRKIILHFALNMA